MVASGPTPFLGQVRLGQVRLGQVRLGQVSIGQVRLGQVRICLGQVCLQIKKNCFVYIQGGFGGDFCDGGLGTDTIFFIGNPASETGVFVNLLSGRGHFADAEHDVYSSIENVVGSEFDDIIQDSIEDNLLMGQGGDDVLIATEGNVKVIQR